MVSGRRVFLGSLLTMACSMPAWAGESWSPYPVMEITPPFSKDGQSVPAVYTPLDKASKPWKICVSLPHMKDAYFVGMDYGLEDEAKQLGVKLNVVEAGGYTHLQTQVSQIEDCVANGAQAMIVQAISYDGLDSLIGEIAHKGIPVIDLGNGVSSTDISAKSLVSFYVMGREVGLYLAKKHPAGTPPVKVGWFPGPAGAGWVEAANTGFLAGTAGSALQVLPSRYGDTGKETQLKLVEDELQANPDMRYVAGTAVTVEAAMGLVRERDLGGKLELVADYMTPQVFSGIQQGQVLAAGSDSMVIQGRIAIDQAVRILEGRDYMKHVGPKIFVVNSTNVKDIKHDAILPPTGFRPAFSVN